MRASLGVRWVKILLIVVSCFVLTAKVVPLSAVLTLTSQRLASPTSIETPQDVTKGSQYTNGPGSGGGSGGNLNPN